MIGYIEGNIIRMTADGVLLLAGGVGYEILLPLFVAEQVRRRPPDDLLQLYIYYHQTDRQPRPVLIGFETEAEKAFFQLFISVEAIGPMKAVRAMDRPVSVIARAIEDRDEKALAAMKGIGKRTVQKMIATLHGKTTPFLDDTVGATSGNSGPSSEKGAPNAGTGDPADQVVDVLVNQLGYLRPVAAKMVKTVLAHEPDIVSAEALFDKVIRKAAP